MKKILIRRYLSDHPGYTHPKILGDQYRSAIPNELRETTVLPTAFPHGSAAIVLSQGFSRKSVVRKSLLVLFVLFSYTYLARSIFGRRQATPLFCPCRFFLHPPMVLPSQSSCLFSTETPSPSQSMVQKRQAFLPDATPESFTVGLKKMYSNDVSKAITHAVIACLSCQASEAQGRHHAQQLSASPSFNPSPVARCRLDRHRVPSAPIEWGVRQAESYREQ